MSDQPCSDAALHASAKATNSAEALDAAHDRDALGLDASVCARTLTEYLRETYGDADAHEFESWFHREFGDPEPPTSRHVDDDPERS